jgi:transcription antitermination factor NusG
VNGSNQVYEPPFAQPWITLPPSNEYQWYAIHTRSQHEKSVVNQLENQGISTFLPLVSELHRWTDRRKVVQLPLFSCYAFVHIPAEPEFHVKVLRTAGVLRLVGNNREGSSIPDSQIASIRALLASSASHTLCPFLKVGQGVRIRGGALDGIQGILVKRNGDCMLIISVEPIQRSIAVRIDEYQVEAI